MCLCVCVCGRIASEVLENATYGLKGGKNRATELFGRTARVSALLALLWLASFGKAIAASAYLGDTNGQTTITVQVEDTFQIAVWVADASYLAGYDCQIEVSGPASAINTAVHGDWFADSHTVADAMTATATRHSAYLSDPVDITGSGDLVIFTLTANDEGTVAISVDSDHWILGDTDGQDMEVTIPSTLYVTVEAGDGGGGEGSMSEIVSDSTDQSDGTEEGGDSLDSATTWYVQAGASSGGDGSQGSPFNNIQDGIDAASDGDTVLVLDGTYTDGDGVTGNRDIDFSAKKITVESQNGPQYCTIDCETSGRAFVFDSGETFKSVLKGFSITQGYIAGNGGAIYISGASPTILNCQFSLCHATIVNNQHGHGGAIYLNNSATLLTDCTFEDNSADSNGGAISINGYSGFSARNDFNGNVAGSKGGAIYCYSLAKTAIIEDNTFENNSAAIGGAATLGAFSGIFRRNTVQSNTATEGGGGIACVPTFSSLLKGRIASNLIIGNTVEDDAECYGGGVYCKEAAPHLTNNTIAGNSAAVTSGPSESYGGGICVRNDSTTAVKPVVLNCIVYNNSADNGISLALKGKDSQNPSAELECDYSNIEGGEQSAFIQYGTLTWGDHNITGSPLFVGSGDYTLQSNSPCINAGTTPTLNFVGYADLAGKRRNNGAYDMGCYEYGSTLGAVWPMPTDSNLDRAINVLDLIVTRNKLDHDPLDTGTDDWKGDVNEDGKVNVLDLIQTRNRLGQSCKLD